MFFLHPGGAWELGGIPRRRLGKIAYRSLPKRPQSDLCGVEEAVFWTGVVEVRVIHTYSPFVPLLWNNHHVGQPFGVFNCYDKSIMQKIIDLSMDVQVAIWVKASHFLSYRLGRWGNV